jgi:hypothetical protein
MNRFVVALLLCLSFALSSHAQTESFWTTSTVPANTTGNDKSSVELGLRFSSNVAGNVTGARVYSAKNSGGTHTVHLWNSNRTFLATARLPACTGWTTVNFASAIAVTSGSTYTISYHTTEYPWNTEFFTAAMTSGNLTAPANAGVYVYGSSPAYPLSSWRAANYWVDVLFTPSTATATYTVSGTVGIGGATVTLSGASSDSTMASSGGAYSFTGLANGKYTVTPSRAGYTFNPPSQDVTITSKNLTTVNFTASLAPPSITSLSPASGPIGTVVAIGGTNFGATQGTVNFDGTAAPVTSWRASSIVVTVPSGANSGNVVVTKPPLNVSEPHSSGFRSQSGHQSVPLAPVINGH